MVPFSFPRALLEQQSITRSHDRYRLYTHHELEALRAAFSRCWRWPEIDCFFRPPFAVRFGFLLVLAFRERVARVANLALGLLAFFI